MTVLRHAAAGLVALAAGVLAVSAIVAAVVGGLFWIASVYALAALALWRGARRLKPRRRRRASGYLPIFIS